VGWNAGRAARVIGPARPVTQADPRAGACLRGHSAEGIPYAGTAGARRSCGGMADDDY